MMFDKINVVQIVKDHLDTLKNDNTKKPGNDDYFIFLILPLVLSTALLYFEIFLSEGAINIIITTLSILVGLLFNVIVLIFDIIKRDSSIKLKNRILKQLLSNISFTILTSIVAIIFTLLTFIDIFFLKIFFEGVVYFLLFLFLFTVLMIIKRMYILFVNEIDEIDMKQNKDE